LAYQPGCYTLPQRYGKLQDSLCQIKKEWLVKAADSAAAALSDSLGLNIDAGAYARRFPIKFVATSLT